MAILTILILFSIVVIVQVLLLAFLQFNSSGQNRFLINKRNFLSIIDNTGLIDKKSKKSIFPPSLHYMNMCAIEIFTHMRVL